MKKPANFKGFFRSPVKNIVIFRVGYFLCFLEVLFSENGCAVEGEDTAFYSVALHPPLPNCHYRVPVHEVAMSAALPCKPAIFFTSRQCWMHAPDF